MPPELLPRDRKELFRERKNERSLSEGGGSNRWRDVKRPGGYGRSFPMLSEESFRGSGPLRSNDKMLDDESGRSLGKYGRSSRENRGGPFTQRGLNRHSSDAAAANLSLEGPASMQFNVNDKRLVDDVLTCNQIDLKDTHDKSGGVSGSCTGQKVDGENSLSSIDWKTLKWTRSGSMSSRGSGLSHSSSSKSMGVDSTETKSNLHPQNVSPLQSPSCDAAPCASPAAAGASPTALTEDTSSRKKPRLGWGEGLAKFEKKKVDIPTDTAAKNGILLSENNVEHGRSHVINVSDRSPRLAGLLSCTSPATPSSVACSSSPGVEDKSLGKTVNVETANLCGSPSESLNQCEGLSCNPVTLEETPIANLCPSINELVQCNDQGSTDSDFVKSTAMNKLLVLKADVSKRIEATESEIDSLETELKLLISETESDHPHPASSSSLPVVCFNKLSEVGTTSNLIPRPDTLQTSGDLMKDRTFGTLEGELAEGKDEDIDSPGTATSKFSEPTYSGKPISQADIPNLVESSCNVSACRNESEMKSLVHAVEEEGTDTRPSQGDSHMLPNNVCLQTENIYDLIIASNKECVHYASEVFSKLVLANSSSSKIPIVDNIPCLEVDPLVQEKFAMRKRFMKFKERVITLKFRVFQHLWKEDLRLLSIKRSRAKPQKKFEFGTRMLPCGYQKHRASIRSRFSSPAGNLSLVPTTQVIDFASKLLEDSRTKVFRSALNMPSLILDNREKIMSRFISSNGLVEDPCSLETERCIINPWTSEEKEIFLDKLSIFGKDFRKIASLLDSKTTADCVEFYYKNHKSDCFQKAKKKPEFAENGKSYSKNTYLVTSGKRWNRDNNAASLDLLGAASAIAANDDDGLNNQKCAPRLIFGSCNSRTARGDDVMSKRSCATNILGSERENVAADVLAGICGSLSSEAMSSCITSSIDIGEGYQDRKCQPMRLKKRRSVTPEVAQDVDEGICSDESCGEVDNADWTDEERSVFIQAVSSYGKDFAMISQCVRTKSSNQCKVFFSKARKCLGLDMMHPGSCSGGTSLNDNADGGGGADTEDASLVETGSGVKSGSKTDDDLSLSSSKAVQAETSPVGTINIHPDAGKSKKLNNAGELDVIVDKPSPEDVSAGSKNARLIFDGDNNFEKSDGSESLAMQIVEDGFGTHTKTRQNEAAESGIRGKAAVVQEASGIVIPSYTNVESGDYVDSSQAGEAGTEFSLLGNSFNEKGLKVTPVSDGNVPPSAGTDLSETGTLPGFEKRNPINLDVAPFSVLQTPIIQDPVVVQAEKSLDLTSNLVPGKASNTHLKISVSSEDGHNKPRYQQSSMDHINPLSSLQAYPPSIPTNKVLNGDIGSYKPTSSQSISKVDRNLYSDHLLPQDSYLPKSNGHGPRHNDMRSEHLLPQDQLKENSRRTRPRCLSDSDQPTRKGDVKLFGQILSHPSAQQKPNFRAEEKDRDAKHAKSSENSYNFKIIPSQNLDGILASTKFDHHSYLGLRDMGLPVRSFGLWDGKQIHTGSNSLPDSAILLAKYPAAFGNYPPSSSNVEQQRLHRVSDCNLNGVSVMPARELSSKGVADYQAYLNCDGAKVQPFAVDLKQQQNRYYSEMQRQRRGSEFDGVSSVQQQRGMVALDVLGRGGILHGGGGPRNTVSDPVAAIRRHYAGEQYNGQIGNIIREEAWRSNGNVGR